MKYCSSEHLLTSCPKSTEQYCIMFKGSQLHVIAHFQQCTVTLNADLVCQKPEYVLISVSVKRIIWGYDFVKNWGFCSKNNFCKNNFSQNWNGKSVFNLKSIT